MVLSPAEYKWSSYRINALGVKSSLCAPHSIYLSLAKSERQRLNAYRKLFESEIPQALVEHIQQHSHRELVLGDHAFKRYIEKLTGCRLKSEKLGRPAVEALEAL